MIKIITNVYLAFLTGVFLAATEKAHDLGQEHVAIIGGVIGGTSLLVLILNIVTIKKQAK